MHTFLRSCGKPLWWLALLCGAWTAAHSAEPVAEQDLKAAYIFNFIQKQADHPGPDHQDPAPGSRHPAGVRSPDRAQP